jgi:DNA-binding MarR family transcriptional regulator
LAIAALFAGQVAAATTAPSADDAPAPAVMAPAYLAIGKSLLVRVDLIRRTLNDLKLDPDNRRRANQILDAVARDVAYLMGEIQAGRMPPADRIAAVPSNLQAARAKLTEVLGPEENQLLLEKLRSVRGEARQEIGQLRQALDDLKTSVSEKHGCDAIVADADAGADKLPDCDLEGDQYAKARQSMIDLMTWTHDKIGRVLTPQEQSQLGASFAELAAKGAATKPSPG